MKTEGNFATVILAAVESGEQALSQCGIGSLSLLTSHRGDG